MVRLFAVLSVVLVSVVAQAHRSAPQRSAVFQVDREGLVSLWSVRFVGREAVLWRAAYDSDHNDRLDVAEGEKLAVSVAVKALGGLEILWDGKILMRTIEGARIEDDQGSSFTAIVLIEHANAHELGKRGEIEVRTSRGDLELEVTLRDAWKSDASAGLRGIATILQPFHLAVEISP